MTTTVKAVLVPPDFSAAACAHLVEVAEERGQELRCIRLPADPAARMEAADLGGIEAAFFGSIVLQGGYSRSFFSAALKAPNLKWLHSFSVGVDDPVFGKLLERGVRLTTSTGTAAVPLARSAITGLLMLSRGFPRFMDAQRRRRWEVTPPGQYPADLDGQTLCILGLGSIGSELARLALGLGMSVIGIRRSPRRGEDPVDELYPPHVLAEVLPRCQWLAITCPLTSETRRLVDRDMLSCLPQGACVINVGRGEIVEETALIDLLKSGHLGGAYLDVFEQEPLPESSPLWDLPNVILSPHQSALSRGNDARVLEIFFDNFELWLDGVPLRNEVSR